MSGEQRPATGTCGEKEYTTFPLTFMRCASDPILRDLAQRFRFTKIPGEFFFLTQGKQGNAGSKKPFIKLLK